MPNDRGHTLPLYLQKCLEAYLHVLLLDYPDDGGADGSKFFVAGSFFCTPQERFTSDPRGHPREFWRAMVTQWKVVIAQCTAVFSASDIPFVGILPTKGQV